MEMKFLSKVIPKKAKPFDIICKTHDIYFADAKKSQRECCRCYFIEVVTSFTNDYLNDTIFSMKDLIYFKDGKDDNAVLKIYYPYDFPALIKLCDYVDTYTGVVDMVAVNKKGWIDLHTFSAKKRSQMTEGKLDSQKGILDDNDKYRSMRERCLVISDDNYNTIGEAADLLKDVNPDVAKKLDLLALKLKLQRSL